MFVSENDSYMLHIPYMYMYYVKDRIGIVAIFKGMMAVDFIDTKVAKLIHK